jgi:hypothetical protein
MKMVIEDHLRQLKVAHLVLTATGLEVRRFDGAQHPFASIVGSPHTPRNVQKPPLWQETTTL